jgi:3-dehydrosphinganine reductase
MRVGPPRLLIHAAGIAEPDYFEALTEERYRRQLEINLTGTWNALQIGVAAMRNHAERPCHILTLSSLAGVIPVFGYTAYGATKFGVYGLSLVLRQELYREGIYVSVLAPGDMDTPGLLEESMTKPPETRALAGNKPLDPARVARYALKKLYQRKAIIVPTLKNRLELFAYRVAPGIGERIMLHMTEGVSRGRKIHSQ